MEIDTLTKQELEALRISLQNFIHASEDDSQITDETYTKLKDLTDNFEKRIFSTLGVHI